MIYEVQQNAKTLQKSILYQVKVKEINQQSIYKYCDKDKCNYLCKIGCPNFKRKWSCPPNAPSYIEFAKEFNYLTVIILSTQLRQFSYIENDYLKIKAANVILKSRIDKALRQIISKDLKYISTGSCRLCKSCNYKKGLPCKHPDIMTYSYEALGVNVQDMVHDVFDYQLLWYKKGYLPEYTSVVTGVLSKTPFNAQIAVNALEELSLSKGVLKRRNVMK